MEAAACVAAFMHQLGAKYAPRRPNAWVPLNFIGFLQSDRWRKDSQVIDFHHDSHDHRKSEFVAFSDVFYGPESDFIEGHSENPPERDAERRWTHEGLRQLAGPGDPLHIAYTQAVTLANSVSSSVSSTPSPSTRRRTSETTMRRVNFPGGVPGRKTLTRDRPRRPGPTRKAKTLRGIESRYETGVAVEFDCPSGAIKDRSTSTRTTSANSSRSAGLFVVDFKITFKLYHWWNHNRPEEPSIETMGRTRSPRTACRGSTN